MSSPRASGFGKLTRTDDFLKIQVLDKTKILHGPQTQIYGEISYFKKNVSARQNQGLAWSSDSNL